jgi:hypothetical protein
VGRIENAIQVFEKRKKLMSEKMNNGMSGKFEVR